MTAKDDLHALIDQLDEEDAAEVLAYARWLLSEQEAADLDARAAGWRELRDERPRD